MDSEHRYSLSICHGSPGAAVRLTHGAAYVGGGEVTGLLQLEGGAVARPQEAE
jgi:hypothetical protein